MAHDDTYRLLRRRGRHGGGRSLRVATADAKGLETFLDDYPDLADGALLVHGGDETFPLTRRVLAAPWWKVI